MRKTLTGRWCVTAVVAGLVAGCARDDSPPPPRASIPPVGTYTTSNDPPPKSLPPVDPMVANPPPFVDEPLVAQPPPEQAAFVNTYEHVGRPRLSLFVNRTLNGKIVTTTARRPVVSIDQTRTATGAVKADAGGAYLDPYGRPYAERHDHFESTGPAQLTDKTEVYLAPGEYDELQARRVDYDAIESVMSDWLAANGRVNLVSAKLSEGQTRQLQQGDTGLLGELSKQDQVDVLVQVQAKVTQQTGQGLAVRLIAEAINTKGGESLGRAFVDVPPPLAKPVINEYTRFLARKLMSDMTQTWSSPRPEPAGAPSAAAPPATPPAPVPTTQP